MTDTQYQQMLDQEAALWGRVAEEQALSVGRATGDRHRDELHAEAVFEGGVLGRHHELVAGGWRR